MRWFGRLRYAVVIALLGGVLAVIYHYSRQSTVFGDSTPVMYLQNTGLYTDFAAKTIDPQNLAYAPQYPLWSDGAMKKRWIYLPPGKSIDASDPDVWNFPAGTKIWKEFSFHGKRVETRLIEALSGDRWNYATYVWSADEDIAALAPPEGLKNAAEIQPGVYHDIPSVKDCRACHVGKRTEILGFSALQLSADRDPDAVHAEPMQATMVDLDFLIRRNFLRATPNSRWEKPPRIKARSATERAVLGYLHANCGNCHNPNNNLGTANMQLRHLTQMATAEEPAVTTTVNRPAGHYRLPNRATDSFLVLPGDPDNSALLFRMETRNPYRQMPPLGTKLVDTDAAKLIRRWTLEDLPREKSDAPNG